MTGLSFSFNFEDNTYRYEQETEDPSISNGSGYQVFIPDTTGRSQEWILDILSPRVSRQSPGRLVGVDSWKMFTFTRSGWSLDDLVFKTPTQGVRDKSVGESTETTSYYRFLVTQGFSLICVMVILSVVVVLVGSKFRKNLPEPSLLPNQIVTTFHLSPLS